MGETDLIERDADSDDEGDQLLPGPKCNLKCATADGTVVVKVSNAAYSTYRAILYWIYGCGLQFASLSSTDKVADIQQTDQGTYFPADP